MITMEENFNDFLFTFWDKDSLPRGGQLSDFAPRSKFFPLRVDSNEKKDKCENGRVASPESVPLELKEE